MHPLEKEILKEIRQEQLIGQDEHTLVVAVSGGADSTALLHILVSLQKDIRIALVSAYINHGLRPGEAEDEERYVKNMSQELGSSCETVSVNVKEHAKQNRISLEHAARDLRYTALREISNKHNASLIAVAHTADDQAEEILIRLLRGSGRKGISGMRKRSNDIVRPLLSLEKDRILRYLKDKNISFCNDSSNTDMRYIRNRVRHALIPFIEQQFDAGVRKALCKTAESLAEDENLLNGLAVKALENVMVRSGDGAGELDKKSKLDRDRFAELPPALQRRTVELLLWHLESRATYSHIIKIVNAAKHGKTGTEIHLSRGLRVGVQRDYLEFLYPEGRTPWRGRLYNP